MIHLVHLPQLELTMENVTIVGLLVREGDQVNAEQGLLEVESQKATSEVPAPAAGFVRRICVRNGETVGEKTLLCILSDTADEPINEAEFAAPEPAVQEGRSAVPAAAVQGGLIKAAPAARKRAAELRVDLSALAGSGPGGRITLEDVEKASSGRPADAGRRIPLSPSRTALIAQMRKSLAEIPQFCVARRMNVRAWVVKSPGITFTHRLVCAAAAALARHPVLRTSIDDAGTMVESVSVAIAMESPHGLVAPAIRKADSLSLEQVAAAARDLRARAEAGTLRREELTNAPFAISNLGMLGVDFFQAFVFHGQTAVLAVGRVDAEQSWFNLAVDHRVVDGAEVARFLDTLQSQISGS